MIADSERIHTQTLAWILLLDEDKFPNKSKFISSLFKCFIIGLVFGLSVRGNLSLEWRLFLATGICGGFTTSKE